MKQVIKNIVWITLAFTFVTLLFGIFLPAVISTDKLPLILIVIFLVATVSLISILATLFVYYFLGEENDRS